MSWTILVLLMGVDATPHRAHQAPASVRVDVGERRAGIEVDLAQRADELTVDVWGIDGLVVRGLPREALTRFQVELLRPEHESTLVVSIEGRWSGARLFRVSTFSVPGAGPSPQWRPPLKVDGRGRRVRVLPASL